MKKWLPAFLLLALVSTACSTQPANQTQAPGAPPAATASDGKGDPKAPRNAATEAMSYCIQCVDRTYDQQDIDKTKLDTLKTSFDKAMLVISDRATTKAQKTEAVRDALELTKKTIPAIPSLTGLDSSLEEVVKAIDTLPEEASSNTPQPASNQTPAPGQTQAPNQPPTPGQAQATSQTPQQVNNK